MRFSPMFETVKSGFLAGANAPNARVTVEPDWQLTKTNPVYGNSIRGPYRWYQDTDDTGVEYEIPNIKSVHWNRSSDADIASCTVTLHNIWHDGNTQLEQLSGQLGRPGYFWPKHGEANNVWNQTPGVGAFRKDGTWDDSFSWSNVLVQNALIRTYEGYGGHHSEGSFTSIDSALLTQELKISGVWIVDSVTASSTGVLTISCKDIGRILIDQIIYPPLVPAGIYPLAYYPDGFTRFDSIWGPKTNKGLAVGSKGEIRLTYKDSSLDQAMGTSDTVIDGHRPSYAIDGDWKTFGLSNGHDGPKTSAIPEWFEFNFENKLTSLSLKAWAGGYVCYVSVQVGGVWLSAPAAEEGEEFRGGSVPGSGITYLKKINIPMAIPDNMEPVVEIDVSPGFDGENIPLPLNPSEQNGVIRLSFVNMYYSGIADPGGQYRCGIRDLIAYQTGNLATPYNTEYEDLPWSLAMTAHPTIGYWVLDTGGTVHGFGQAADYDSTGFGPITFANNNNGDPFRAVGITAHPSGKGYWVLDESGKVTAHGAATHYGQYLHPDINFSGDIRVPPINVATGIAATHTGNGYWVAYSDGLIKGFGDADPVEHQLTTTWVTEYMSTFVNTSVPGMTPERYIQAYKCTDIVGHPTKMAVMAVNADGEVSSHGPARDNGEIPIRVGELNHRIYDKGMAHSFKLGPTEQITSIEVTNDGNGIWLLSGSGKVAPFGTAKDAGPIVDVYRDLPKLDIPLDPQDIDFQSVYRSLIWSMARDPDGTGFWLLRADGSVLHYDAEFWGQPGYTGQTGWRWHAGNFTGEWTDIVKELLLWSGFTFYDPELPSDAPPMVYGNLEGTGIKTDTTVSEDKWDKKTVMDVIKELAEVVAYDFRILEDGRAAFLSPNIWGPGNFDDDGIAIYVTYDENGIPTRVDPEAPGAEPFIPVIDEMVNMFDYSATLSGSSMRSELIIGTDAPDPKDPTSTGFVRKIPHNVGALRGIESPALWISQLFKSQEEIELMAELIALRMWFAERTGSTSCVPNPCLSVGDQVRLVERNTNETYIHLINSIDSTLDLDAGTWSYQLTTNWLGDADDWVISTIDQDAPYEYVKISERVDSWLAITDRALPTQGGSVGDYASLVDFTGSFDKKTIQLPYEVDDEPDPVVDPNAPDAPVLPEIPSGGGDAWLLVGSLTVRTAVANGRLKTNILSKPLGSTAYIQFYNQDSEVVATVQLGKIGQSVDLPTLGVDGATTTYPFVITGDPAVIGNGTIGVTFSGSNVESVALADSILVLEGV